jgi:hypothetical protein
MVQKGLHLFESSPIYSIGAKRFTKTFNELAIPYHLASREAEMDRKTAHNSHIQ